MPVINFKPSLTKQLKHGHKNSIKSSPPLSTDLQVSSQDRARSSALAGSKQEWMSLAPARWVRAAEEEEELNEKEGASGASSMAH